MFEKNYDAVEFGARIKKLRKDSGMTQETLADLLYLSSDSISRMENGKGMCMPEHVVHICEIFNTKSDYLYFGNDESIKIEKTFNEHGIDGKLKELWDKCSYENKVKIIGIIEILA